MALDTASATPLFQQLAEELRQAIRTGEYPPGSQLPTEHQLCDRYQVSRVTVRKALEELSQRGEVIRRPGKGTFVANKKFQRDLTSVLSFTEMCRHMGYSPGSRTVKIALEPPDEDAAHELALKKGEQMLVVERLRLADGVPVLLETTRFPEKFFFLFHCDLNNASLYQIVKEQTGVVFTHSVKTLEIVFASYQEARYLGVAKGYPLLSIRSTVWDDSGENRYLCQQLCIGDKFKLMV